MSIKASHSSNIKALKHDVAWRLLCLVDFTLEVVLTLKRSNLHIPFLGISNTIRNFLFIMYKFRVCYVFCFFLFEIQLSGCELDYHKILL